jgi:RimJ/RimL family protein N-acetyltransferase
MRGDTERPGLPEVIGDHSVVLRIWEAGDAEPLRAAVAASDEAFRDWLPGVFDDTRDVPAFLSAARELFEAGSAFLYAIVVADEVVGQISLNREGADEGVLGYWLRTDRTRRGSATAALRLLSAAALARGYERLELRCDEGNARSAAVARRAGYSHVSTVAVAGERTRKQTGREMIWEMVADTSSEPDGRAG